MHEINVALTHAHTHTHTHTRTPLRRHPSPSLPASEPPSQGQGSLGQSRLGQGRAGPGRAGFDRAGVCSWPRLLFPVVQVHGSSVDWHRKNERGHAAGGSRNHHIIWYFVRLSLRIQCNESKLGSRRFDEKFCRSLSL
jgi:hypothetical protein